MSGSGSVPFLRKGGRDWARSRRNSACRRFSSPFRWYTFARAACGFRCGNGFARATVRRVGGYIGILGRGWCPRAGERGFASKRVRIARTSGGTFWGWGNTVRFRTGRTRFVRGFGDRPTRFGFARASWRRKTARSLRLRANSLSFSGGRICRFGANGCRVRLPIVRFGGRGCTFRLRGFRRDTSGRSRGRSGCWASSCRRRGGRRSATRSTTWRLTRGGGRRRSRFCRRFASRRAFRGGWGSG